MNLSVAPSGKSVVHKEPGCFPGGSFMSDHSSELVEISKLNGDFRKNYGKLVGAYLYLRSISAARGRSLLWSALIVAAFSVFPLFGKLGWLRQLLP